MSFMGYNFRTVFKVLLLVIIWLIPSTLEIFAQEAQSSGVSKSFYDLILSGELNELQQACRERGLADDGDAITLKRRLIDYERKTQGLSFEERAEGERNDLILLNNADFIRYGKDENGDERIVLNGNVDVVYRGRKIRADEVLINSTMGLLTGKGNVQFVDNGKLYTAENFFYDTSTDEGYFYNARTTIGNFIYTGSIIKKTSEEGKFVANDVSVTTCEIEHPHYRMQASELFIDESERVLAKDASFIFGQDEVFYLPYFYRNLRERALKSALFFRERSGLVLQNTYTPVKSDEKELVLKGDFYERLGFYTGVDYKLMYEKGETDLSFSGALSNDVFYYEDVTENWSPLGPHGSESPGIRRSLRYRMGGYQRLILGTRFQNKTELNLLWLSDPYYEYDFERRASGFDVFELVGQPESDFPRKGSGYSWYLNNYLSGDGLSVTINNIARFEPQRNTDVELPYLTDYYEYRLYSITAPRVTVSHGRTILNDFDFALVSNISYSSYVTYSHLLYFDPYEELSSELHRATAGVQLKKSYRAGNYVLITPALEVGAQGQHHVEAEQTELSDDRLNTLVYTRASSDVRFGTDKAYARVSHDLKYKLFGPEDQYEYNRFRIHNLGFRGYLNFWWLTEEMDTSYDLRPRYNWTTGRYEPLIIDKSRFDPLRNTLTFSPAKQLIIKDLLVYNIAFSRFETNRFSLLYNSGDIPLGERSANLVWELSWNHNFMNPFVDGLQSVLKVSVELHRFWSTYFQVYSRNDAIWRYLPETAGERGVKTLNPFLDLVKSFNFFNTDDRKASQFKLKSISFGFIHDLHDWELKFDYTGNRELSYDGKRYIWDDTYSISIRLKDVEGADIHTKFQERR
ncbi:MAG: hypothetical protein ACUVWJ_02710 [Spirochaetota bacterium]